VVLVVVLAVVLAVVLVVVLPPLALLRLVRQVVLQRLAVALVQVGVTLEEAALLSLLRLVVPLLPVLLLLLLLRLLDCAKGDIPKAQQVRAVFSALSRQSKQSGLGKRAGTEAPATPVNGIAPTSFPRDD
jgi:hypothetical protein